MRAILRLLALAGCATPLLAAAPADFAAVRDIRSAALDAPRLVEIRLDGPLLAATRPGFPDLRLFDAAGQELPRLVEPLHTTQERIVRHAVAARPSALKEIPDNRIETRLDLEPDEPAPDGLDIRTPLRDFIRTVRVSGSDDGQSWRLLAEAEIFDYSRYMDLRRTEISLPENACRHFSIEISNAAEERAQPLVRLVQANGQDQSRAFDLLQTPFRIDGISFWRDTTVLDKKQPLLREWPHSGLNISDDRKAKTTAIEIRTDHAPVTRLDLETADRNFRRAAAVQIPALANGTKTWRTVATGAFTRLDLPGLATNALAIEFPEQRVPELRLVIENHDNPPLAIAAIRPSGPVYRLLWLAEPAAAYQLAYGNDALPVPSYDLFAIRAALENGLAPDLWELAPGGASPRPAQSFSGEAFFARPAVFGTALVLAALALLGLLAKALKQSA